MTIIDEIKAKLERGEDLGNSDGWVLWYEIARARAEAKREAAAARAEELRQLEDAGLLRRTDPE